MKFAFKRSAKAQKGFTLVELSVVVLVAGLMLTAVMKGQTLVESARAQKLLNDIKNIETSIGEYENLTGRLPGDCNRNGIFDYPLNTGAVSEGDASGVAAATYGFAANSARGLLYSYSGLPLSGAAAGSAATQDQYCAAVGGAVAAEVGAASAGLWINDLRNAEVINKNTVPRAFAKHIGEDFIFVGSFVDGDEAYNAMTIANVPYAMAKRVMMKVNGSETITHQGQMRVINATTGATYVENAFAAGDVDSPVVNLVYFYRNQPKAGK